MDKSLTPNDHPVFWRAEHVARVLGVSKKLLIRDVLEGRTPVPVRTAYFGASRIAHFNVEDAKQLVRALNTPNNGGTL